MKYRLLILLGVFLSLNSCEKSELKKPTRVTFSFDANTDHSGEINIQESSFILENINIEGKRQKGADINFSRQLDLPLVLKLDGSTTYSELNFDIPQGNYTKLQIDLSNYPATSSTPGIEIIGKYKLTNGPTVSVKFEITDQKLLSILATENDQSQIELDKKASRIVNITFDFGDWLSELSATDLDNADLIIGNSGQGLGNSTILINSANNIDLYNSVLTRINQNNSAEFN